MELIGLSGYARSGKDETANILMNKHGFRRVAFADKLREVLYQLNPWVWRYHDGLRVWATVQEVIDEYGWDGYKETWYKDEIRRLLQRLGTEAGRNTLWDSIWIDAALTGFDEDAKIVVTDCRFPNEAQAIKDRGGEVWRITRPGVKPINPHPSETSLDDWAFDNEIINNGTLSTLGTAVSDIYKNGGGIVRWSVPQQIEDVNA